MGALARSGAEPGADAEAPVTALEAMAGSAAGGFSSFHDDDTSAEVDAAFRSQRRIAVAYFVVFVAAVGGVAGATVWSRWSTTDLVLGGFSPSFLTTAVGLYLFFVLLAIAASTLANGVDDRMLGAPAAPEDQ